MEQSCWDHNPAVSLSNHFSVDTLSLCFNSLLKTMHPSKSHFSDLQWFNSGPCCSDAQVYLGAELASQVWNPAVMLVVARCETGVKTLTQHFTPVVAYFHIQMGATVPAIWAWLLKSTTLTLDLHCTWVWILSWCWVCDFGFRFMLIPLFNIYILLSSL